jgi:ribonuclease G
VLRALRGALAEDPAPTETTELSRLGLVELTRGRQRPALAAWWTEACPSCDGSGRVATVAAAVEAARREAARSAPGRPVRVRAAPPVAAALRQAEPALETVPDPALAPRGWRLEGG